MATYRRSEKYKAWQGTYNQSEIGKERARLHKRSAKGKASQRRYTESEKFRLSMARLKAEGSLTAYGRKYRQSEKGKATLHRQNISEKGQKRIRRYRQSEKGMSKSAEIQRRHRKTEKGYNSVMRQEIKRRTALREVKITLTRTEWQEIKARYNNACAYCGATGVKLEQDHVIPIIPREKSIKGGDHVKENVVPACRRCNARKSNKILASTGYSPSQNI